MGKIIKFPENDRSNYEDPDIIDGKLLIGPVSRVSQLIFGKNKRGETFENVEILDSEGKAYMQLNYNTLELNAPLDWLADISDQAREEYGPNFAEVVQTHLLTTIYAKKWINNLDCNKKRKKILDVNVATKHELYGTKFDIEYSNARELELWRAASSIALKTVSHRGGSDRKQLLEFLDSQYALEIELQLEQQGFRPHNHFLRKLVKNAKSYQFDSYTVGSLAPMSDEELLKMAPEFLRAANS